MISFLSASLSMVHFLCTVCTFKISIQYLISNASKTSNMKYKTLCTFFDTETDSFFGFVRLFSEIFLKIFCIRIDVRKSQRVSSPIFRYFEIVQTHFSSNVRFSQYISSNFFNIRILEVEVRKN